MTLGTAPARGAWGVEGRMGWAGRASARGQSGANGLEDGGPGGTVGRKRWSRPTGRSAASGSHQSPRKIRASGGGPG